MQAAAENFLEFQRLLTPPSYQKVAGPGKQIKTNQPDVEITAMIMRQFPCTKAQFDKQRGDKDWVKIELVVCGVGPPGFSGVPYTANSKTPEKTLPLYELDENGRTKFHTFLKGKTNKDKGVRVFKQPSDDKSGDNEDVVLSFSLEPGICLTNFVREDAFNSSNNLIIDYDEENSVLAAGSMVYVQLSSSNVEQAIKGNMLKIRKIKVASDADAALQATKHLMPQTEQEFEQRMARAGTLASLQKMIYNGNTRIFMPVGSNQAYISRNELDFVLCSFAENVPEICVSREILLDGMGTSDDERALKLAMICCAAGALDVVVKMDQVFSDGKADALKLSIDVDKLLMLRNIYSMSSFSSVNVDAVNTSNFCFSAATHDENLAIFNNPNVKIDLPVNGALLDHNLVFSISRIKTIQDAWNESAHDKRMLSDGCASDFHALTVWAVPQDCTWYKIVNTIHSDQEDLGATRLIKIQLRPNSQTSRKRLRPILSGNDPRDM